MGGREAVYGTAVVVQRTRLPRSARRPLSLSSSCSADVS